MQRMNHSTAALVRPGMQRRGKRPEKAKSRKLGMMIVFILALIALCIGIYEVFAANWGSYGQYEPVFIIISFLAFLFAVLLLVVLEIMLRKDDMVVGAINDWLTGSILFMLIISTNFLVFFFAPGRPHPSPFFVFLNVFFVQVITLGGAAYIWLRLGPWKQKSSPQGIALPKYMTQSGGALAWGSVVFLPYLSSWVGYGLWRPWLPDGQDNLLYVALALLMVPAHALAVASNYVVVVSMSLGLAIGTSLVIRASGDKNHGGAILLTVIGIQGVGSYLWRHRIRYRTLRLGSQISFAGSLVFMIAARANEWDLRVFGLVVKGQLASAIYIVLMSCFAGLALLEKAPLYILAAPAMLVLVSGVPLLVLWPVVCLFSCILVSRRIPEVEAGTGQKSFVSDVFTFRDGIVSSFFRVQKRWAVQFERWCLAGTFACAFIISEHLAKANSGSEMVMFPLYYRPLVVATIALLPVLICISEHEIPVRNIIREQGFRHFVALIDSKAILASSSTTIFSLVFSTGGVFQEDGSLSAFLYGIVCVMFLGLGKFWLSCYSKPSAPTILVSLLTQTMSWIGLLLLSLSPNFGIPDSRYHLEVLVLGTAAYFVGYSKQSYGPLSLFKATMSYYGQVRKISRKGNWRVVPGGAWGTYSVCEDELNPSMKQLFGDKRAHGQLSLFFYFIYFAAIFLVKIVREKTLYQEKLMSFTLAVPALVALFEIGLVARVNRGPGMDYAFAYKKITGVLSVSALFYAAPIFVAIKFIYSDSDGSDDWPRIVYELSLFSVVFCCEFFLYLFTRVKVARLDKDVVKSGVAVTELETKIRDEEELDVGIDQAPGSPVIGGEVTESAEKGAVREFYRKSADFTSSTLYNTQLISYLFVYIIMWLSLYFCILSLVCGVCVMLRILRSSVPRKLNAVFAIVLPWTWYTVSKSCCCREDDKLNLSDYKVYIDFFLVLLWALAVQVKDAEKKLGLTTEKNVKGGKYQSSVLQGSELAVIFAWIRSYYVLGVALKAADTDLRVAAPFIVASVYVFAAIYFKRLGGLLTVPFLIFYGVLFLLDDQAVAGGDSVFDYIDLGLHELSEGGRNASLAAAFAGVTSLALYVCCTPVYLISLLVVIKDALRIPIATHGIVSRVSHTAVSEADKPNAGVQLVDISYDAISFPCPDFYVDIRYMGEQDYGNQQVFNFSPWREPPSAPSQELEAEEITEGFDTFRTKAARFLVSPLSVCLPPNTPLSNVVGYYFLALGLYFCDYTSELNGFVTVFGLLILILHSAFKMQKRLFVASFLYLWLVSKRLGESAWSEFGYGNSFGVLGQFWFWVVFIFTIGGRLPFKGEKKRKQDPPTSSEPNPVSDAGLSATQSVSKITPFLLDDSAISGSQDTETEAEGAQGIWGLIRGNKSKFSMRPKDLARDPGYTFLMWLLLLVFFITTLLLPKWTYNMSEFVGLSLLLLFSILRASGTLFLVSFVYTLVSFVNNSGCVRLPLRTGCLSDNDITTLRALVIFICSIALLLSLARGFVFRHPTGSTIENLLVRHESDKAHRFKTPRFLMYRTLVVVAWSSYIWSSLVLAATFENLDFAAVAWIILSIAALFVGLLRYLIVLPLMVSFIILFFMGSRLEEGELIFPVIADMICAFIVLFVAIIFFLDAFSLRLFTLGCEKKVKSIFLDTTFLDMYRSYRGRLDLYLMEQRRSPNFDGAEIVNVASDEDEGAAFARCKSILSLLSKRAKYPWFIFNIRKASERESVKVVDLMVTLLVPLVVCLRFAGITGNTDADLESVINAYYGLVGPVGFVAMLYTIFRSFALRWSRMILVSPLLVYHALAAVVKTRVALIAGLVAAAYSILILLNCSEKRFARGCERLGYSFKGEEMNPVMSGEERADEGTSNKLAHVEKKAKDRINESISRFMYDDSLTEKQFLRKAQIWFTYWSVIFSLQGMYIQCWGCDREPIMWLRIVFLLTGLIVAAYLTVTGFATDSLWQRVASGVLYSLVILCAAFSGRLESLYRALFAIVGSFFALVSIGMYLFKTREEDKVASNEEKEQQKEEPELDEPGLWAEAPGKEKETVSAPDVDKAEGFLVQETMPLPATAFLNLAMTSIDERSKRILIDGKYMGPNGVVYSLPGDLLSKLDSTACGIINAESSKYSGTVSGAVK